MYTYSIFFNYVRTYTAKSACPKMPANAEMNVALGPRI